MAHATRRRDAAQRRPSAFDRGAFATGLAAALTVNVACMVLEHVAAGSVVVDCLVTNFTSRVVTDAFAADHARCAEVVPERTWGRARRRRAHGSADSARRRRAAARSSRVRYRRAARAARLIRRVVCVACRGRGVRRRCARDHRGVDAAAGAVEDDDNGAFRNSVRARRRRRAGGARRLIELRLLQL